MAARIFYQEDCNLSVLEGQTIAIIGYGSQGHAHALNLKDSGCNVIIGLYEGSKSWAKAEADVRTRIQHPLRMHHTSGIRRCNNDRSKSTRTYSKKRISGRKRNTMSDRSRTGLHRKSLGQSTCLRSCNRWSKSRTS